MRIESLSPILARSLMAALPKVASGFPPDLADPPLPARTSVPPHLANGAQPPMPSVAMLVTLAASDPGIERRRKQAVEAERGVDLLDRLHKELLSGTPRPERLQEIAQWSQNFEVPSEPTLAAILSDIDLRVRVELAKLDIEA